MSALIDYGAQAARLAIACPQCHAAPGQRCTNYSGQHCAAHSQRRPPAAAPAPAATPAAAPTPAAEPAAAAAAPAATTIKLTDQQIAAMVEKIEATIASHDHKKATPSNVKKCMESQRKLEAYVAELARRQAARPQPAPQPPPRDIGPSHDVIADAISQAAALIRRWGAAQAIRALDAALRQQDDPKPIDVADGTRMMQMVRRRTATEGRA